MRVDQHRLRASRHEDLADKALEHQRQCVFFEHARARAAHRTRTRQHRPQIGTRPLARHLHQAQLRDAVHAHAAAIGGEHLVTLPALRAAHEKYPDLAVVHFDAHTDLREEYLDTRLSHATVLRRIWDVVGDGRIHQFGIRSGERAEWRWAAEGHTDLHRFGFQGLDEVLSGLRAAGRPVYLTIDLDVLDPSCFPGTGTPEAGGVTFAALLSAALRVIARTHVVACDLVELSPPLDPSGISTATALKLLREMLLALERPHMGNRGHEA